MRTYGKSAIGIIIRKKTNLDLFGDKEKKSTEWDLRLDVSEELTASRIVEYVKDKKFIYVSVSGVEEGPERHFIANEGWRSVVSRHVHCALVVEKPITRHEALAYFRIKKSTPEYAAVRRTNFTYLGWKLHHAKEDTKLDGEPAILYEGGTLPMDPFNEETSVKVASMISKYGRETDVEKYEPWIRLANACTTLTKRKRFYEEKIKELDEQIKKAKTNQ
jgi:hypothetical protein